MEQVIPIHPTDPNAPGFKYYTVVHPAPPPASCPKNFYKHPHFILPLCLALNSSELPTPSSSSVTSSLSSSSSSSVSEPINNGSMSSNRQPLAFRSNERTNNHGWHMNANLNDDVSPFSLTPCLHFLSEEQHERLQSVSVGHLVTFVQHCHEETNQAYSLHEQHSSSSTSTNRTSDEHTGTPLGRPDTTNTNEPSCQSPQPPIPQENARRSHYSRANSAAVPAAAGKRHNQHRKRLTKDAERNLIKLQAMFHSSVHPTITLHAYILRLAKFLALPSYVFVVALVYLRTRLQRFEHLRWLSPANTHRLLLVSLYIAGMIVVPGMEQVNIERFAKVGGTSTEEMERLVRAFDILMCSEHTEEKGEVEVEGGYAIKKEEFANMVDMLFTKW